MRVLAFEDSYDILALLESSGVDCRGLTFQQHWNSSNCLMKVKDFEPDILMLDFYMPPYNGLQVLTALLEAVSAGTIRRPKTIVAMSSEPSANQTLLDAGADLEAIKFEIGRLLVWESQ